LILTNNHVQLEASDSDSDEEQAPKSGDINHNVERRSTSTSSKKKRQKRSPGTLYELSQACRKTARRVPSTGLFVSVYDNINLMFRVAEQILGRTSECWQFSYNEYLQYDGVDTQENGTCATIFPLWNGKPEDMLAKDLHEGIMNAPPLTVDDIQLNESEADQWNACMAHTILRIIINHGGPGFNRWRGDLEKSQPVTADKIEVHKTDVHPLPAFEVDESSIVGNTEVNDYIDEELELNQDNPEYNLLVRINAGDQHTQARQRAILAIRGGHEDAAQAYKGRVFMPGLFHGKMTDIHRLLETHFGKPHAGNRSPGSLAYHNTCLNRLPIVLSSLPPFSTVRDLVMVSLYARVLHCLLLVSGKATLDDYLASVSSWDTVHSHAGLIYQRYANADLVQEMRERRIPEEMKREAAQKAVQKVVRKAAKEAAKEAVTQLGVPGTGVDDDAQESPNTAQLPRPPALPHVKAGDMVFENAQLLLRDQLISREFSDAVKCGDSGRIVVVLKVWACSFRGHGHSKYAHKMLHIIHNLTHVWTKGLR
jgi:hypothetical protein